MPLDGRAWNAVDYSVDMKGVGIPVDVIPIIYLLLICHIDQLYCRESRECRLIKFMYVDIVWFRRKNLLRISRGLLLLFTEHILNFHSAPLKRKLSSTKFALIITHIYFSVETVNKLDKANCIKCIYASISRFVRFDQISCVENERSRGDLLSGQNCWKLQGKWANWMKMERRGTILWARSEVKSVRAKIIKVNSANELKSKFSGGNLIVRLSARKVISCSEGLIRKSFRWLVLAHPSNKMRLTQTRRYIDRRRQALRDSPFVEAPSRDAKVNIWCNFSCEPGKRRDACAYCRRIDVAFPHLSDRKARETPAPISLCLGAPHIGNLALLLLLLGADVCTHTHTSLRRAN